MAFGRRELHRLPSPPQSHGGAPGVLGSLLVGGPLLPQCRQRPNLILGARCQAVAGGWGGLVGGSEAMAY